MIEFRIKGTFNALLHVQNYFITYLIVINTELRIGSNLRTPRIPLTYLH